MCVCNVISRFCFSTHHPVCFDQWDGISDELWKDFCASFTFILFSPPKMDFFNLNKAKVIDFCTSSAIFLVPLAAFGGEQLNSRHGQGLEYRIKIICVSVRVGSSAGGLSHGGTAMKDARTRTAALSTQSYWGILEAEQLCNSLG